MTASPSTTNVRSFSVPVWDADACLSVFGLSVYRGRDPYIEMADAIFGEDRIREEANKLHAPLAALGYSEDGGEKKRFRRVCALAMLVNRSPYAEALSAQAILAVNELLPSVLLKPQEWIGDKISFACKPRCAIWVFWMSR